MTAFNNVLFSLSLLNPVYSPDQVTINDNLVEILKITGLHQKILELSCEKPFIERLVEVTQQAWLRKAGSERHELQGLYEDKYELLLPFLRALTLCEERFPARTQYDYALILGSLVDDSLARIKFLKEKCNQVSFKHIIVLTGMRPLTESEHIFLKERYHVDDLKHEAEMIAFLLNYEGFDDLSFTLVCAPLADSNKRPTTNDTLHYWIERHKPQAGRCLAISTYPYAPYQESALKTILPKTFFVEMVGIVDKDITLSSTKTALILDSLARWIYQEHKRLCEKN